VCEGQREPYANLHELEKAIRQKCNKIDDQTIKKAILQWKKHLAASTKQFSTFYIALLLLKCFIVQLQSLGRFSCASLSFLINFS